MRIVSLLSIILLSAACALAGVDVVTLPNREGTQLTIYNTEDITMVREHRLLTVKEGVNKIQFAWTNTLIDPTSIEFRILDNQDKVELVDLVDFDETFSFEEEIVSGKPVPAKAELERRFDDKVVLWGEAEMPKDWTSSDPGAYVDLHQIAGRVERVDQQHVKYFFDLPPGKKQLVSYSVTYKRRKVGPEINTERKREPL